MTNTERNNKEKVHSEAMAHADHRGSAWLDNTTVDNQDSEVDSECEDEEEDDADTCSSFSLQECIDEFRARRIRRISTQSREYPILSQLDEHVADEDEDLVEQNRSNKEHERKCKPCKNGFCYCFTSDSGDGGCSVNGGTSATTTRAVHMRRSRKSENMQLLKHAIKQRDQRRRSAPATCNTTFADTQQEEEPKQNQKAEPITTTNVSGSHLPLTAISRLETSSKDAPLIHIIQELHNNCVISEVRVNKHKIEAQQRQHNIVRQTVTQNIPNSNKARHVSHATANYEKSKHKKSPVNSAQESHHCQQPSAPPLETISEINSAIEALEICKLEKQNRRSKYGGRLLRKRLSYTGVGYKPKDINKPPRKPPRSSQQFDSKCSDASTTPSVRNAKQVIDQFLLEKGVTLPTLDTINKHKTCKDEHKVAAQRDKRRSYPLTPKTANKSKTKQLRTYPSLSDFEQFTVQKKPTNYAKNISYTQAEKPMKEITLGWAEPKISEMLNCDTNANRREFKSHACQAEPQTIGWQIPPKVSLDTVDGPVQQNLATNIEHKDTPVKSPQVSPQKSITDSTTKFIWGEQLRNLSPFSKSSSTAKPKSNLKSASSTFLHTSKKKILRLVTPKKDNKMPVPFVARKTPLRSIGIQTSHEDLQSLQSPPGSYHSTAQHDTSSTSRSQPSTPSTRNRQNRLPPSTSGTHFDFNRTVSSPPKKQILHSQRKLNFPLNCAAGTCVSRKDSNVGVDGITGQVNATKTYRSFNTELDQDLSLSKMNYILGNIRARLEASDEHAMRTFQDIERRELQAENSLDYTDNVPSRPARRHCTRSIANQQQPDIEPIYSEIEEDSIHITASPQFENKTGTGHFFTCRDPSALYAKVNKPAKQKNAQHTKITATSTVSTVMPKPLALGTLLHDSLTNRSRAVVSQLGHQSHKVPLSDVTSSEATYTTPPRQHGMHTSCTSTAASSTTLLSHCQSLNNVGEQHSPPKKNRNLSKSDLSLQRSEIFLENLCRSELVINETNASISQTSLQKVENNRWTDSYVSIQTQTDDNGATATDAVSYEVPPHEATLDIIDGPDASTTGSQLAINASTLAVTHKNNQSTPKKTELFTTKREQMNASLPINLHISTSSFPMFLNESNSCPATPSKNDKQSSTCEIKSSSLNEMLSFDKQASLQQSTNSQLHQKTKAHYKRLKTLLRKSFRKSKNFVKTETKRLSQSFSLPAGSATTAADVVKQQNDGSLYVAAESLYLERLFAVDELMPVQKQLAQAVSICRQLPNLEISTEMVEAERLLLFSTLRDSKSKQQQRPVKQQNARRYYIDAMRLPINADASQDIFFNYFYIVTFECGGVIRSTQSVECHNGEAVFRDCGIELDCICDLDALDAEIRCEIFMLRLRKVSTLTLEPPKKIKLTTPSPSSSSSMTDIVSRFRLHANFSLKASDFKPYEYVECASRNAEKLCLRASDKYTIPITRRTMSSNLSNNIQLTARAEIRLPKHKYAAFLNVEEMNAQHNWNRRWCTLDGIHMRVWQDNHAEHELLCLDLRESLQAVPLEIVPRELCARPRAFCLQCLVGKTVENDETPEIQSSAVFFAADTLDELNDWLQHLNEALEFINKWMQ